MLQRFSAARVAWRQLFSRSFWLNLGLKTKMTLMVWVGLTTLVVFFGFLSVSAAQQTTARALQERVILAQLAANHSDYVLGHAQALLEAAATHATFSFASSPNEQQNVLRETRAQSGSLFHQIFLVDATGAVRAADPPLTQALSFAPVLSEFRADTRLNVSSLQPGDADPMIVAATPVRAASGQISGALIARLDLSGSEISVPVQAVTLGQTGYLEVVDSQGLIVLSTRTQRLLSEADHRASLSAMIRDGKSVVANCTSCHRANFGTDREPEVIAFAPMKRAPWGVVVRQTEAEAFASARQLQGQIVAIGVLSVLGAMMLVWLTTRSMIAPIQNLTRAAKRIARGDLETPIQRTRGDEIGALAQSFDEMRARLQTSIAEIQSLNRDLDLRVQERTRELAALNAVAMVVAQPLHLDELLEQALAQVLRVTGVQAGAIFLLDAETRALTLQARRGVSEQAAQSMMTLHLDDSACGGVIEKGHPVVVPDLGYYRSSAGRALWSAGLQGLVHVPLISRRIALGTLCVATARPHDYQTEELELLMAIGSQIAVGIENARLYDELARREQLRGELLDQVIAAQEDERKRIARDLHDDTSQSLSALIYSLEAVEASCPGSPVRDALVTMRQRVTQILDGIHKLIFDLRPSMLDHLGLFVALRWYAETHLQPLGVRVHLEERGAPRRLPSKVETALFRVVQEAINNIAKHSGARNVHLNLDCSDGVVAIQVADDGIGFDLNEVARAGDRRRGLGLVGMQERVGLLGGKISLISDPGQGTQISIYVPV
ncbi:MAG: HAMP domain-containing protein [Chloroflexi bacterium]|nr:HAMP domain-containing protein [Chloroflexota bacterium]